MPEQMMLSELLKIHRSLVDPRLTLDETFYYYNIPSFDECRKPEVSKGGQIESSKFVVNVGDILISKLNPRIKRVWRVDNNQSFRSISSTEFVDVVSAFPAEREFLYHLLNSDVIYRELQRTSEGTTNSHVRFKADFLPTITIQEFPPRDSWPGVAEILSTVDEAIEQTEALIAKTQQIKAGLMHDLFTRGVTPDGHLRPPREEAPHLYKESPLGWIPKEWDAKTLSSLSSLITKGATPTTYGYNYVSDTTKGRARFLRAINATPEGHYRDPDPRFISEEAHRMLSRSQLEAGDTVLSIVGARVGTSFSVDATMLPANINQNVALIRSDLTQVCPAFVSLCVSSNIVQDAILNLATTQAQPSLSLRQISDLCLPIPTLIEQKSMVCAAETLADSASLLRADKDKLSSIKVGLMHDLLTGRVQVKVSEPSTA